MIVPCLKKAMRAVRLTPLVQFALLTALMSATIVRSAAPPSTAPAAAVDDWLNRAAANIRAAADEPADKPVIPSALDLAMMLVQARGNEQDRALLRDLLQRPRPPLPRKADPATAEFSWKINTAIAYAALRDVQSARQRVREAEKSTTERDRNFLGMLEPALRAKAWAAAGDIAAARAAQQENQALGDRVTQLVWLARDFHDVGRTEVRDQLLQEAKQLALEREDVTRRAIGLREIAKEMIDQGCLTEAHGLVEQMPVAYPRSDAYIALARAQHAEENAPAASRSLVAAIETLDAMKDDGSRFYAQVADAAAELGDRPAVTRAVAAAEQYLREAQPEERAASLPHLARSLAAVGDVEGVRRLVAEAQAAMAAVEDPERRADATLDIAAAFARIGDRERAEQEIARAKSIHREEDYSVSEEFSHVLNAFISAGHGEHALKLAREHQFEPADFDWLHEQTIRTHVRARRFDAARESASHIVSRLRRVRALRVIALAQAKAGEEANALAWIAALPAAADRAVLYLGLAQQALKLEGRGLTRMLRF